jgi:response regulator of citrate/malate metabolism
MEGKMESIVILVLAGVVLLEFFDRKRLEKTLKKLNKEPVKELSEEEKQKQAKIKKAFNNLMEYDEKQALKRGEVDGD